MTIEKTGELGSIGIGVGLNGFPKGRGHPGWIKGSFGYHGGTSSSNIREEVLNIYHR